jgi:aspartyl-tRNA synthetase
VHLDFQLRTILTQSVKEQPRLSSGVSYLEYSESNCNPPIDQVVLNAASILNCLANQVEVRKLKQSSSTNPTIGTMSSQETVPKDPAMAPSEPVVPEGSTLAEGEQSKKGAKKAEAKAKKEAEKARKAAEREAAAKQAGGAGGSGEDLAKDNYGDLPKNWSSEAERIRLEALDEKHIGKVAKIRGSLQNSRMQGAKIAFIELGKGDQTIQGVLAVSPEGKPVSRQMVKWAGSVKLESVIMIEALVQKPVEPVKSCTVSGFELHITKLYVVAPAPEMLPISVATASRAVGGIDEDDDLTKATAGRIVSCFYLFHSD